MYGNFRGLSFGELKGVLAAAGGEPVGSLGRSPHRPCGLGTTARPDIHGKPASWMALAGELSTIQPAAGTLVTHAHCCRSSCFPLPAQILGIAFFSVIHVPVNVPALSVTTGHDADINAELRAHGISNIISGLLGGLQNYLVYSTSVRRSLAIRSTRKQAQP
jgi:hypothetical protein